MIKTYYTINKEEAECFDGSEEMMNKYHIKEKRWSAGGSDYFFGPTQIHIGDYFQTPVGVPLVMFAEYFLGKELPVIPSCVDEWLMWCQECEVGIEDFLKGSFGSGDLRNARFSVRYWLQYCEDAKEHRELATKAWVVGYETEKHNS
jgi:hypothetical protein